MEALFNRSCQKESFPRLQSTKIFVNLDIITTITKDLQTISCLKLAFTKDLLFHKIIKCKYHLNSEMDNLLHMEDLYPSADVGHILQGYYEPIKVIKNKRKYKEFYTKLSI